MNPIIKNSLNKFFPSLLLHYHAYKQLIGNRNSYIYSMGWMRSLSERKPVDIHGKPIPWMNYPTITLLKERLNSKLQLFEFGSGYSTFFYSELVKDVISVEYDRKWYDMINSSLPDNVKLLFQSNDIDGEYCRVIGTTNKLYDVVIIDGRDRVNCLKQSISALSPSGVILLDDSHRDKYKEGYNYAKERGFRALNIEGLKPTGSSTERTTFFYRDNNCLGI